MTKKHAPLSVMEHPMRASYDEVTRSWGLAPVTNALVTVPAPVPDFTFGLKQLHDRMASLRDELTARGAWTDWTLVPMNSAVSMTMLENACQPDGKLLDWSVYETLLIAAGANHIAINDMRTLHRTLEWLKAAEDRTRPPDHDTDLHQRLAAIRTQADLMAYLRELKHTNGWSLRDLERRLEFHYPNHSSRGALGDWLAKDRDQLPRKRERFKALVLVMLPDYPDLTSSEAVRLVMQRYDQLLHEPSRGSSAEAAAEDEHENSADYWRAKYEQAERNLQHTNKLLKNANKLIAAQKRELARSRKTKGRQFADVA